jgi:DNA-binding SARP family transcriptional activator
MDFRILGPLEVWEGERQIELGGPKRRAVLAYLVLHANEVVAVDRLVDQLWGEKAPRNAAGALHTHVSRLRKELGPEVVARQAWGYVLRVEPGGLDLERFERLTAEAENCPASERAAKLREALGLWRGPPLEDLAFEPALAREIARLEELRLTVLENRIDADLEAGNQAGLVAELEGLIAEYPLRERLRGQLILALYRCGRQAEALEVYRETRRVLADELGLEPSPELRELERAILQHDPALRASPGSTVMVVESGVRPGRRRRLYIGTALALLCAGVGTAASYTLTTRSGHAVSNQATSSTTNHQNPHLIRWTSLVSASSHVVHTFDALIATRAPQGMNPQLADVRKVPLPDGGTVLVAPVPHGGFCEDYTQAKTVRCDRSRSHWINPTFRTVFSCGEQTAQLGGHLDARPGSTLDLEFSGGSLASLRITWVGAPINAGFFEQTISAGKRMSALVLRLPSGAFLAAILASKTKMFQALNEHVQGPMRCAPQRPVSSKSANGH